jgi:hypothetical protein
MSQAFALAIPALIQTTLSLDAGIALHVITVGTQLRFLYRLKL